MDNWPEQRSGIDYIKRFIINSNFMPKKVPMAIIANLQMRS